MADQAREAWIIDGVRSPRGRGKATGSLHEIHPQELLAQVLNGLAERVGFDLGDVDDVICGNGDQASATTGSRSAGCRCSPRAGRSRSPASR